MIVLVRETCPCCSGLGYFPGDFFGDPGSCSLCVGRGFLEYDPSTKPPLYNMGVTPPTLASGGAE